MNIETVLLQYQLLIQAFEELTVDEALLNPKFAQPTIDRAAIAVIQIALFENFGAAAAKRKSQV